MRTNQKIEKKDRPIIEVNTIVNAPLSTVWEAWTNTEHIVKWTFASDDWHAAHAENDLRTGG